MSQHSHDRKQFIFIARRRSKATPGNAKHFKFGTPIDRDMHLLSVRPSFTRWYCVKTKV